MNKIKKIIKCPSCNTCITVSYDKDKNIENENITCPNCKNKHRYTEYLSYSGQRDLTNLGDAMRYIAANRKASARSEETELGNVIKTIATGSLRLPGKDKPVALETGHNIIGRKDPSSKATIQVDDPTKTMSRSHYYIDVIVNGNTVTHTLQVVPTAKNETLVNGVKVEKNDTMILSHGCKIRSGLVEVEFIQE